MHHKRRCRKKYAEISIMITSECATMKFTHSMCICCSAVSSIVIIAAASYTRREIAACCWRFEDYLLFAYKVRYGSAEAAQIFEKDCNSIHTFDVRALSRATGSGSGLSSDSTISCFRNQRLRCGRFAEA